jgi:Fe-S-cluster containining protein
MAAEVKTSSIIRTNISAQRGPVFPCFCCGICCSDYQPHLDLTESQNIADHLGISLQQFYDDCTDPRWPGTDTHLLLKKDGMCLFLEQKEGSTKWLCQIHDFKPDACRRWTASLSQKECLRGLSRYWGLSVDDSGKMIGSPEDLKNFQTFLKTLN